jgi:hypothetical protein
VLLVEVNKCSMDKQNLYNGILASPKKEGHFDIRYMNEPCRLYAKWNNPVTEMTNIVLALCNPSHSWIHGDRKYKAGYQRLLGKAEAGAVLA